MHRIAFNVDRSMWGRLFVGLLVVALQFGCSQKEETGPGTVRWDRDTCVRCAMAISDRHHAAQIRSSSSDEKPQLYLFDDFGCAMIWMNEQTWKNDPTAEVWVAERSSGEWLNARTAGYVGGEVSPMDYGLGAVKDRSQGVMGFQQAREQVFHKEGVPHRHGH